MTNTIYATFANPHMAKKATGALLDYGVRSEHMSIIFPEGYRVDEDGTDSVDTERGPAKGISTTTAADAAEGAAKGVGFGLVAGTLATLAAVFIPGVGLVLGGGALAIALGGVVGATAAGAAAGGVAGYLKDQGLNEDAVLGYTNVLSSGGAFITVSPTDENIDAVTIQSVIEKYEGIVNNQPVEILTAAR
jgi:hypothetical protein